jgi:hypothetical protein
MAESLDFLVYLALGESQSDQSNTDPAIHQFGPICIAYNYIIS